MVHALEAPGTAPLPVVVRGSIGERLVPRWPAPLRARCVAPAGDSADGALALLRAALGHAKQAPEAAAPPVVLPALPDDR
jgi:glucosamine kinase